MPEKIPSLGMDRLKTSDKHVAVQSSLYLSLACTFEKQFNRLAEIGECLLYGVPLTGNIQFRTKRNVSGSFFFKNRCK